ncbi:MAG: DUF3293 domain-containing protein [Nevskia sp.]|nr:DUF3293 domain-containing protein [Nevskia sp.]
MSQGGARSHRQQWEAAYRACHYLVLLDGHALILRPGIADPLADRRLAQEAGVARAWAVLTPCNPGSAPLDAAANAERLERLRNALAQAGLNCRHSLNRDPAGRWPDEPGFLVCDPPAGLVDGLARAFGQNAYLAGGPGTAPALVWLAGCDAG